MARKLGDTIGEIRALNDLGVIANIVERWDEAHTLY